jgi:hypothetical protein
VLSQGCLKITDRQERAKMPKLKTEFVCEGMVVGSDVRNIDNMLLIPSGSTLTERQINTLKAWGITELDIASANAAEKADPFAGLSPDEIEKLLAELKDRFWQPDENNPVFMEIFKCVLHRRVRTNPVELVCV